MSPTETVRSSLRLFWMVILDMGLITAAYFGAFLLRFDGDIHPEYQDLLWRSLPLLLALRLVANGFFGAFRWAFRFASAHDAMLLAKAIFTGTLFFVVAVFLLQGEYLTVAHHQSGEPIRLPWSIPFLEMFMTGSSLMLFRYLPKMFLFRNAMKGGRYRTLIVGAGGAGELVLRAFLQSPQRDYRVIGFVDDDRKKRGTSLHQIPVMGDTKCIPALVEAHEIEMLLIAMPSAQGHDLRRIMELCQQTKVQFRMVNKNLLSSPETMQILKDLDPEDLLDRQPINLNIEELSQSFQNKAILVTGAAGSIGGEIVRQLCTFRPKKIVMLDFYENELYLQWLENTRRFPEIELEMVVANVREEATLRRIFERVRPRVVFHAAAQKQVPLMEAFPEEAVKTNIFGTLNVGRAAAACGAETVVFISSDKAVNPTNVMGVTKRIGEFVVKDLDAKSPNTRFTAVRFGNVLGSQGSLLPIIRRQILAGGPVTITHPEITRFFMTIPEAVQLVLTAAARKEGTVQVLQMGDPIRIDDLVRNLITLSGLRPDIDIRIQYIGLRPGEKLHEELIASDENLEKSSHEKILVAHSRRLPEGFEEKLTALQKAAEACDHATILTLFKELEPGFTQLAQVAPTLPAAK